MRNILGKTALGIGLVIMISAIANIDMMVINGLIIVGLVLLAGLYMLARKYKINTTRKYLISMAVLIIASIAYRDAALVGSAGVLLVVSATIAIKAIKIIKDNIKMIMLAIEALLILVAILGIIALVLMGIVDPTQNIMYMLIWIVAYCSIAYAFLRYLVCSALCISRD